MERITIDNYNKISTENTNADIYQSLSKIEKYLCNTLARVEIIGKRGRVVPLLFTPELKESLDLLVSTRRKIGIPEKNNYVFARITSNATTSLRGSDCIRKYAHLSGIQYPETVTSTRLRKHIATISQVMNLKDFQLEQLANYLGHDISVHRNFYRLPESTLQVAKVSRVLLTLEKGNIEELNGKSLDEVDLDLSDYEDEVQSDPEDIKESEKVSDIEDQVQSDPKNVNESQKDVHSKSRPQKRKWSSEEQKAVLNKMKRFVTELKVPGKLDCDSCKNSSAALVDRSWRDIKYFVYNRIQTEKNRIKALQK